MNHSKPPANDDDYYALARQRVLEESQKSHTYHKKEIEDHITGMIPHYDDADEETRRSMIRINTLLIQRFEEPGMVYWSLFEANPQEIYEYRDWFGHELIAEDLVIVEKWLNICKNRDSHMVDLISTAPIRGVGWGVIGEGADPAEEDDLLEEER